MRRFLPALIVTLTAAVAFAEDAQQTFDAIYGDRIKEVTATRERDDDVALAGDLLTVAKSSANQPELLAVICEASYDLGRRHPSGYRTGVDAMALLTEHGSKQQRDAARENTIDLLTRLTRLGEDDEKAKAMDELIALFETIAEQQSTAGDYDDAVRTYRRGLILATRDKHPKADAIKAQMEAALERHRVSLRIKRLREQLLTNADPAAAEELALIYTLDLNDAAKAVPYLRHAKDEALKAMVTLAATDPAKLDAEQSLKLGEWYHEKAKEKRGAQRLHLFRRAKTMLSRYLALTSNGGLRRADIQLKIKQIQEDLVTGVETTADDDDVPKVSFNPPAGAQLVLRLSFDEADDQTMSSVVDGKTTAFESSGTTSVVGVNGKARYFNGRGDYLSLSAENAPMPNGRQILVAAWVKPEQKNGVIFAHGGELTGYALYLLDGRPGMAIRVNRQRFVAEAKQPLNQGWSHIVGLSTADGDMTVYVNGKPVGKGKASKSPPQPPGQPIDIGRDFETNVGPYNDQQERYQGLIDELVVYFGGK